MKILMKMDIAGTFEGNPAGVQRGDEVEVSEQNGLRYIANGYADAAPKSVARQSDTPVDSFVNEVAGGDADQGSVTESPEPESENHEVQPVDDGPVALDEPVPDEVEDESKDSVAEDDSKPKPGPARARGRRT